jgi:hypothetical protein
MSLALLNYYWTTWHFWVDLNSSCQCRSKTMPADTKGNNPVEECQTQLIVGRKGYLVPQSQHRSILSWKRLFLRCRSTTTCIAHPNPNRLTQRRNPLVLNPAPACIMLMMSLSWMEHSLVANPVQFPRCQRITITIESIRIYAIGLTPILLVYLSVLNWLWS